MRIDYGIEICTELRGIDRGGFFCSIRDGRARHEATSPTLSSDRERPRVAGLGPLAVTHDRLLSGSEIFAGSTKERPGPWPGLSVQTGVRLSSDALLLASTQYQEATDEQRQPTSG